MPAENREDRYYRILDPAWSGHRMDRALADCFPEFSRAQIQRWLANGALTVDGVTARVRQKVRGGEQVELCVPSEPHATEVAPEAIALDVLFEDASILVVNKPAGQVMHPGAGNASGTLQNALVYHDPELACLPRSGIVHRLDKDTTGVFVVARSHSAHRRLVAALAEREVTREYEAVVRGTPLADGCIDAPIGRHRTRRQRMAVTERGRPAVTHYHPEQHFDRHTLVRCRLESGRTHQIRVHMASAGLPLVGDPIYGRGAQPTKGYSRSVADVLTQFPRQALHARRLALRHPATGSLVEFHAPRPRDLSELVEALAAGSGTIPQAVKD